MTTSSDRMMTSSFDGRRARREDVSGPERIRVLVADDHPLFRDGIARAVQGRPELELLAATADGRETLDRVIADRPDVAVVDLRMPGLDGLAVLETIRRQELGTRVIVLSAFTDPALVYEALAAGAAGYFSKDAERDAICDAITGAARGETVLDPALQAGVLGQIRTRGIDDGPVLTPREREVLELIAGGLSAPSIAARLHLSTPTVKTHLAHVYEKLGVSDRAAAVAEGMRRGIVR
jgi:two-component system nitrate/nitrite response regulator NarL